MKNTEIKKLHAKLINNHQQLVAIRNLLSKKSDKYSELKMEMLMDVLSDTLMDISAFIIISNLGDSNAETKDL
jgi:hypothetical protein